MMPITNRLIRHNAFCSWKVTARGRESQGQVYLIRLFYSFSRTESSRLLSSQSKIKQHTSSESSILLYERSSERNFFPRSAIGFTSFQTVYWIWYVLDFTPHVNRAASIAAASTMTSDSWGQMIQQTMVDPKIGYFGLLLGTIMSVGAFLYPKYLINQIRFDAQSNKLHIKTYQLPFVTIPTDENALIFPRGSVYLENSADVSTILDKYNGDLSQYRGHMGLQAIGWRGNLLLQLVDNGKDEVKDPDLLFQLLLRDNRTLKRVESRSVKNADTNDFQDTIKPLRIRKRYKRQ